jgi:hypothetical protein
LIDFLAMLYMGSWKTEALLFNVGSIGFGRYGGVTNESTPLRQTVLKTVDLEKILNGNWFSRIHRWPSLQLSLPPDSKIAVRVPAGGTDANGNGEIRISNRFCTKWGIYLTQVTPRCSMACRGGLSPKSGRI